MKRLFFRIIYLPYVCCIVIYMIIMAVVYVFFWFLTLEKLIERLNQKVQKIDDYIRDAITKKQQKEK